MYPLTNSQYPYQLKHIVYVDDDEEDRVFFREVLKEINKNIKLTVFEYGFELICFLRSAKSSDELPCSIICDMQMPLLHGIELLNLLKKEPVWQHIPVVIFSTSSNNRDSSNSTNSGATAFFSKPNSLSELKTVVSEILGLCSEKLSRSLKPGLIE